MLALPGWQEEVIWAVVSTGWERSNAAWQHAAHGAVPVARGGSCRTREEGPCGAVYCHEDACRYLYPQCITPSPPLPRPPRFRSRHESMVDTNATAYYNARVADEWLSLRCGGGST